MNLAAHLSHNSIDSLWTLSGSLSFLKRPTNWSIGCLEPVNLRGSIKPCYRNRQNVVISEIFIYEKWQNRNSSVVLSVDSIFCILLVKILMSSYHLGFSPFQYVIDWKITMFSSLKGIPSILLVTFHPEKSIKHFHSWTKQDWRWKYILAFRAQKPCFALIYIVFWKLFFASQVVIARFAINSSPHVLRYPTKYLWKEYVKLVSNKGM